jgi:hypothetical protein
MSRRLSFIRAVRPDTDPLEADMSSMESEIQWFIAREGKQHGPISDVEMKKLVEMGHLRPNDLLWRLGFADWRPAPSVFPRPAAATFQAPPSQTPPQNEPSAPAPFAAPAPAPAFEPVPNFSLQPQAPQSQPAARQPEPTAGRPAQNPFQPAFQQEPAPRTTSHPANPVTTGGNASPGFGSPQPTWQPAAPASTPGAPPFNAPFGAPPRAAAPFGQTGANTSTAGGPPGPRPDARPVAPTDYSVDLDEAAPSGRWKRVVILASILALAGGGGWYGYTHFDALKGQAQQLLSGTAKTVQNKAKPAAGSPAAAPAAANAAAAPDANAIVQGTADIDARLQKTKHWAIIREQFGDWYQNRIKEAARISAANRPSADVATYLTQGLVELRRAHADKALAASSGTLKAMATAFQANVGRLAQESTNACIAFIVSGESSAPVVQIIEDPQKNAEINTHFAAIFSAVAEGAKTPTAHSPPTEADYKLLVAQLSKLGWAAGDLQLFADPQGPAKTPADRYCKMMQEFFAAHLAVEDAAAQERLLFRTLKLVVAG